MSKITVKSLGDMQQLVVTTNHTFIADESTSEDNGQGPDPYELLLASLGT